MTAVSPDSTAPRPRAPVSSGAYATFACIAAAGCLLDLLTKRWVFQWRGLPGQQPVWWIWDGILGIETSLNTGALFGIGQNQVRWFAVLSFFALAGILYWFVRARAGQDRLLTVILGCVTGGILGNLYDRLGLWTLGAEDLPRIYAVRDWIRVSYGDLVWPNFNLADSLLVSGALLLIWHAFRSPPGDGTEQVGESR